LGWVEIVCVGNELLIGRTLNTNEHWLARRATTLGFQVSRITTVGDDLEAIEAALREALARGPRFVLVTGGLGSTFDDKTLEGAALALGRPLKLNDRALGMVRAKYEAYSKERGTGELELTPARVKMAELPEGAEPMRNPVGTAPGVRADAGGSTIFFLPGVPSEMEAIFDGEVAPAMRDAAGDEGFYEEWLHVEGVMESSLAPLVEEVMRGNPHVYVKSHPKGEEGRPVIDVHLSTVAGDEGTAGERLRAARRQLQEFVEKLKG